MGIGNMSDDEPIDVENYSDSDEADQNVRKNTVAEKSDEKTMGSKTNGALNKNADLGMKDEMSNMLYGIVHKLFGARVVLKRLSSPEIKKLATNRKHVKKPIKRLKIKKDPEPTEAAFIHEGNAYMRICPKCRTSLAKRKTQHCLSCETALVYECQKCLKQFAKYGSVMSHIESKCFIKGFYHCPACDYKTLAPSKVKAHIIRLHPTVEYDKETLKWSSAKQFRMHECSQCAKQFDNHESLNMHIPLCNKAQGLMNATADETVRVNKDFQKLIVKFCPKCDKITKVYDSGVSSLHPCQKCGSSMKFKCSQCEKQYQDYCSVAYHTKLCFNISKPQPAKPVFKAKMNYSCKHCEKQFKYSVWLKRHLLRCEARDEPKPRPFHKHLKSTCKNCDKRKNIRHRRKICVDCQSSLHFQCTTCNKNFTADVRRWCEHLKTYFDLAKYECDNCGARLVSRVLLINHIKICMEGSDFCCDLCTFTTKLKSSLYRHMVFVHPVVK